MGTYTVKFYTGEYIERQRAANADRAVLYVEHHFNSTDNQTADYTCVIVGSNAGRTSKEFGQMYARKVAESFGCRIGGVNGLLLGGYNGRGDGNIKHTNMPAVLLEPLFISNPKRAAQVITEPSQHQLAKSLAACIKHFFPNGGLIGFSIGHKGKRLKPNDRGAAVHGSTLMEADIAEIVLKKTEAMLNDE
jgi:N-acetylmuramoyl-L-alanine amidase